MKSMNIEFTCTYTAVAESFCTNYLCNQKTNERAVFTEMLLGT